MSYVIAELAEGQEGGFSPRGGALKLWKSREHEVMLSGPAETGKTFGACHKLDALLWKYPGSQAVLARKTQASLYSTVFQTYRKVVNADSGKCPLRFYGGEKAEWVGYPNKSRLWLAGLDNPQRALSSERDFIYINQAEELILDDYEILTTRCTGRAANAPYAQLFGDCNPGPPQHWILDRSDCGVMKLIESRHEDNPTLYDEQGVLTERGRITMSVLDALTGVRYQRLRLGKWAGAEGLVYEEWDRAVHRIPRFEIPKEWRRIRVVDFGYTNPFVCLWIAIDPDGRMFLYREIYHTKRLVRDHARQIIALSKGETIEATVADHDAEDRATMASEGIDTIPAYKAVTVGIEAVQARLKRAGDGRPRLFMLENSLVERDEDLAAASLCVCSEQEWSIYQWPKAADGKPLKEEPLKMHDHGCDGWRYGVAYVDGLGRGWAANPDTLAWLKARYQAQ